MPVGLDVDPSRAVSYRASHAAIRESQPAEKSAVGSSTRSIDRVFADDASQQSSRRCASGRSIESAHQNEGAVPRERKRSDGRQSRSGFGLLEWQGAHAITYLNALFVMPR